MALPYVPVPDVLQANVRFTCAGQQLENVMCFSYASSSFHDGCIDVTNVLNTAWWPDIRMVMSSECRHIETYMVDLASASGPVSTSQPNTPSTGGQDHSPMPNNVTICVTFRTEQRGRSYRGRSFVIGLADNCVLSQNVVEGAASRIFDAYNNLLEAASAAGTPLVVVSRENNKQRRAVGVATPVTTVLLRDTVIDAQRRRLPGRGK